MQRFFYFFLIYSFVGTGCSVLIGSVKPVSEKSDRYEVTSLNSQSPDWVKLDSQGLAQKFDHTPDEEGTASSDLAFQSKTTASIISLNTACRPQIEKEAKDLRSFTNLLILGMSQITERDEKSLEIESNPALQTTLHGKMNSQDVTLRVIVFRKDSCVYDFMYVSKPELFETKEPDFSKFVSTFHLKS